MSTQTKRAARVAAVICRGGPLAFGILAAAANATQAMPTSSRNYAHVYGQGYGGADGLEYDSRQWPALTDDEIAALRAWLGPRAAVPVVLLYRPTNCAALEQSLGRLFDSLHWPRADAQGPLLDENPEGLTLLPDSAAARDLQDAIQALTRFHVDIRSNAPASLGAGEIVLIVGERPQLQSGRVVRSFDGGCR